MTASHAAEPAPAASTEARTPLSELGKDDPYLWMEEIEGTRAMDWAKAQNARTLPVLQGDARYAGAARFFLDELYGPGDFSQRDAQFARVVPA